MDFFFENPMDIEIFMIEGRKRLRSYYLQRLPDLNLPPALRLLNGLSSSNFA